VPLPYLRRESVTGGLPSQFRQYDRTSLAQYVAIFNRLNSLGVPYVPYLDTSPLAYRLLATLLGINRRIYPVATPS